MAETQRLLEHFYIKLNGALNDELMQDMVEVVVDSSLQLPDMALLTVHDTRLKWADDANLDPGKEIEISSRSESGEGTLFKGEIVSLEPDFTPGAQKLVIRCFDKVHRLTRIRKTATYLNMKDSDIVSKLAGEGGVSAEVDATRTVHKHVYQDGQSHWDFLRERMAPLGMVMYGRLGKLHCKKPAQTGPEVELKWGETLLDFRPSLSTAGQRDKDIARGWDYSQKQKVEEIKADGAGAPAIGESRSGSAMAALHLSNTQRVVVERVYREQAYAAEVVGGAADRRTTQFVEAEGSCKGDGRIVAGAKVKITNIGTRFSGSYLVTTARHIYDHAQQGYTTEFSVSGHHVASVREALLGGERSPGVGERIVIGIVTNNQDPDSMGRVKVKFPWLDDQQESNWARVLGIGGGNERGILYLPEIDDEVLVAFELGDIDHPFILGGLWNGQDKLPEDQGQLLDGSKVKRRIHKSRDGHFFVFEDVDGAGGITIQDRKGNIIKVESADDKMTVNMAGDIIIEAKMNVTIKAGRDMSLEATGNVSIEAGQELQMKASLGASLDGGVKVDVKGGMINLN